MFEVKTQSRAHGAVNSASPPLSKGATLFARIVIQSRVARLFLSVALVRLCLFLLCVVREVNE